MKSHFHNKSLAGIYEKVGGVEAFRRISKRFHHKVELEPGLKGLFPKNMSALEERLALYLSELTGDTAEYSVARGKTSLLCRHAHLAIGTTEAELWLKHMKAACLEEEVDESVLTQLLTNLTEIASSLADPFINLYRLPLEDLRERLEADPSLAVANDHGRNLICAAAVAWDVTRAQMLLEFGASVEMKDSGGHNPLYRTANGQGREEDGVALLDLLIKHGANVNQVTGVGAMTPLHMAARRGTVFIAEALIAAGAVVDARDSNGETPLRRAVNCGQEGVVRLLIAHGANPLSRDRKGITVLDSAKRESIKKLLSVQI